MLLGSLFLVNIWYSFNTASCLMALVALTNPTSPEFLSSLFLDGTESFWYRIPFTLFQLHEEYIFHGTAFVMYFTFIPFMLNAYALHVELE